MTVRLITTLVLQVADLALMPDAPSTPYIYPNRVLAKVSELFNVLSARTGEHLLAKADTSELVSDDYRTAALSVLPPALRQNGYTVHPTGYQHGEVNGEWQSVNDTFVYPIGRGEGPNFQMTMLTKSDVHPNARLAFFIEVHAI